MWSWFHHWFDNVAFDDPLEQRQASLFQIMLLGLIGVSLGGAIIPFFTPIALTYKLLTAVLVLLNVLLAAATLFWLRRGSFRAAVRLITVGLVVVNSVLLYLTGIHQGGAILLAFTVPVVLAGLLLGRPGVLLAILLSTLAVVLATILERMNLPFAGSIGSQSVLGTLAGFVVLICLLGLFIDHFGAALRQTLSEAQSREHELTELYESLEYTVERRTMELQRVLDEVQVRSTEQARLLDENERQRQAIRELSVPVLPVSTTSMVMPIVGALDTDRLSLLQERALDVIERTSARQLFLDITGVPMVDSQVAQGMLRVVQAAHLLGAEVILIGVRPEVAQAIVGLGIDLSSMRTFSDLQTALSTSFVVT